MYPSSDFTRVPILRSKVPRDTTSHQSEWPSLINPQITSARGAVEKREPSCTAGGNVNWYSHYGEQFWRYLRNLYIELPYDPAIPLLGIYPDKTLLKRDTCTRMFIAALFTIARTWKKPKCSSTDDWIQKMWYIYKMEYSSAIKKNDIMPFAATWMELETLILSEMSQKDKDKYHMISLITGI